MPLINHMSPMTSGEKLWFETQADKDKRYIHHPCIFHFPDGMRYTPDFYCIDDNVFIELICTRQAFFQNKHKYNAIKLHYPQVSFQIVKTYRGNINPLLTRPGKQARIDRDIAVKYGTNQAAMKRIILGEAYTRSPLIAMDVAGITGADPLSFIHPMKRERYAAAFPFMVDRSLPIPVSVGPNPTKKPRKRRFLSSDFRKAVNG